jgi:nucleoside-diphosphate-sugar epimerase
MATTGYVRTYIVSPGMIYGLASGPVLSAGLAKRQSFPVSWVIKAGAANGSVGTFADGSSVWPYVHIDDIAGLFIVLLDALRTSPERAGHGWEGFYFGATASPRAGDIARYISDALAKVGQIQPAQGPLKPWTKEEIDKLFGGVSVSLSSCDAYRTGTNRHSQVTMLGTNCHAVATRARALGWKPKYTAEDIPDGILVEVEHMYGKE